MKPDFVLVLFALIFGSLLGHYVLSPTYSIQGRIVASLIMLGCAYVLTVCNSILTVSEDELFRREVEALFGKEAR